MPRRTLTVLPDHLAVCRLPAHSPLPLWASSGGFHSLTRTEQELSIVCPEGVVPPEVQAERGFRALRLEGPIPFEQTGVLSALLSPLAAAEVPVFALSTYDTDYLLVREGDFHRAIKVLAGLFALRS